MGLMTTLVTAAVFSVLSLNTCGGSERNISVQERTEARLQLNLHPEQTYCLRIKINDTPGPLKLMGKFGVGYKAESCSYVINCMEGATTNPGRNVETQVRQPGEFEYEAIVYADAVLNENCFGEGVCHWRPDGLDVAFRIMRHPREAKFNFGDFLDNLVKKKTLTKYLWNGSCPYTENKDGSIFIRSDGIGFAS